MDSAFRLALPSTAMQLAVGETKVLQDGTPVRRFKRFAIQVGKRYVKRVKGGVQVIDATEERCNHWLSMWNACKANGLPVKATQDHQDRRIAKNIMGDIVDICREGDWITLTMDIRGQENIAIAEANKDVSIEVDAVVADGAGNQYRDVIAAVTFTPIPVVVNQPIAASMAEADEPYVLELSQEKTMTKYQEALAKLSGKKADDISEANACELVDTHLSQCSANATKMSQLEAQITKLSQENEPDTRYLSLAVRTAEKDFDQLKDKGVLDVATCDGLKKLFFGEKKDDGRVFSAIALSMANEDEALINFAEKVASLLQANKPVGTKEQTPAQIALSREIPDAGNENKGTREVVSPWTNQKVTINA